MPVNKVVSGGPAWDATIALKVLAESITDGNGWFGRMLSDVSYREDPTNGSNSSPQTPSAFGRWVSRRKSRRHCRDPVDRAGASLLPGHHRSLAALERFCPALRQGSARTDCARRRQGSRHHP